ncbi:hypothetical protein [Actinomyces sp.]|uniref:hypothetical protein n=1 Tax=Actinomyces sp. TaxID=29317 RepID=UPI0029092DE8|nr:hypothetical protein [Actinomyces sp.]MDU7239788.1 hypothetical protein [Actinomyces sp.]
MTDNTDTDLTQLGAQLAETRAKEAEILARLTQLVRAEHACGMSEYKLAEQAQVTRSTIRAWLGKK